MQPSSLVFLVIIAVWAAYFLQYWVRRREHLATARSVDQFSESMRVLERRSPLPAADLSTPLAPSYAVSQARPARAQILVKRAASAEPAVAPAARAAVPSAAAPARASAPVRGRSSVTEPRAKEASGQDRIVARRNRAMIMLGALSTVVVSLPLVALGMLPLVTLLVPVASIAIAVAWARATAVAERQSGPRRVPTTSVAPVAPSCATHRVDVARDVRETTTDADVDAELSQTALFDVQAVEQRERETVRVAHAAVEPHSARPMRLVDEDDIPLTWDPVPVPRPTYTMKSRATRPAPTAADLVGDADTEYAAYEEIPVRRVAGA
ncbi:MAG TPA: hypothetical protein VGN48_14830 [Pedococcus sp.]|nr:hypothetical protein [Pedococcus sp.]